MGTPKPKGVKVETPEGELRISWSTLGFAWPFLAIPAAVLCYLLFRIVVTQPFDVSLVGGLLLFGLPSLAMLYVVLVSLLNKTVVEISGRTLEAGTGPIPYKRRKSIDLADIRQVCVTQVGMRNRAFRVCVLAQDGARVTLYETEFGLTVDGQLALYLEQEIEQFLGIPDEVVRGEWRPEPYLWEG